MADTITSVESARESARDKLKGVCAVYRICDGGDTRICQGHSYGSPIGMGGIGSGASFAANLSALAAFQINARLIGPDFTPDTRFELFGRPLAMPILGASVSGVNSFGGEAVMSELDFCRAVVLGCRDAGSLGFRGDSFNYTDEHPWGVEAIAEADGWGVPIFKPRAQDALKALLARAAAAGAVAAGVDVDGYGSFAMNAHRMPVFRKSVHDLAELAQATALPFVVKGVMGVDDAEAALAAGARAIVVSNHGGRVLDHTPGTAAVLPEIARRVKGKAVLIADGGVRTGYDVFKMLALGADAVMVGRDLVRAAVGGGRAGVRALMALLGADLAKAMKMTGAASLAAITPASLRKAPAA